MEPYVKRITLFVLLPFIPGLLLGLYVRTSERKPEAVHAKHAPAINPPPDPASWAVIHKTLPDEFNILLPIRQATDGALALSDLCVAVNLQDNDNFCLLRFGPELQIVKVENGLMLPLTSAPLPGNLPAEFDVVIKRRARSLAAAVNGRVVASTGDACFTRGQAVAASLNHVNPAEIKVQRVGEIYFADDFMKGAEQQSAWEVVAGSWQVNTLQNSSLSSNAFFYTGRADGDFALSTAGYWFWDNYAYEASCKSEGVQDIGLCFHFRNASNYFRFSWSSDSGETKGRKQLVKVVDGNPQILAEQPGGYTINQWYKMEVRINRQSVRAFIDDNLIFSEADDSLAYGRVGLYSENKMAARFDDVFVRDDKSIFDSFASGSAPTWEQLGGSWSVVPLNADQPNGPHALRADVASPAKAIIGDDSRRNYTFAATVSRWKAGSVGLVARYLDESNHYLWVLRNDNTHQFIRTVRGVKNLLAEGKLPDDLAGARAAVPERPHTLFMSVDEHMITAGIDGRKLVEKWDESIDTGRAGLFASETGPVFFENASLTMKEQPEPILTTNVVFQHEKTMENWASDLSDWLSRREGIDGKTYLVSMHRADFPGDVEMSAKLPKAFPADGAIRLSVAADEQDSNSGYSLMVTNGDGYALQLFRKGQPVGRVFAHPADPMRISLQRKGVFVIGLVNYKPAVRFEDNSPLTGTAASIAENGMTIPKDDIDVYCPKVKIYTFDKACFDWRVATGTWQVTNRWQCDPRWSFFAGVSTGDAVIWCKRLFHSDLTVEFAAGIKMDSTRGGRYEYASDINATICADGKDITSGYSFMFGGWQNSSTRIMRGDKVLAESKTFVIPNQQDMHRRWFYIKIRKRGTKLQYFIDNRLILEADDLQPLTGDRLAIWTHNNGVMLAKVRLSCLDQSSKESPDFKPTAAPVTPYTPPPTQPAGQ